MAVNQGVPGEVCRRKALGREEQRRVGNQDHVLSSWANVQNRAMGRGTQGVAPYNKEWSGRGEI